MQDALAHALHWTDDCMGWLRRLVMLCYVSAWQGLFIGIYTGATAACNLGSKTCKTPATSFRLQEFGYSLGQLSSPRSLIAENLKSYGRCGFFVSQQRESNPAQAQPCLSDSNGEELSICLAPHLQGRAHVEAQLFYGSQQNLRCRSITEIFSASTSA